MSKVTQAQIIQDLIDSLQGVTDEKTIKKLTINAWQQLKKIVTNENTFRNTRTELRKNIRTAFPSNKKPKPGYYFTTEGKGKIERHEHLALWYATTNESRWNVVGDVARQQYFNTLRELPNIQPSPQPQPEAHPEPQSEPQPELQPESQLEPQLETQPELQPESQLETQPEPQPELQPEPQLELQPEPQLEPQPEPQPEPQLEPQPEPQLEPQPEPQPELQLELQPEPQPETQTLKLENMILQQLELDAETQKIVQDALSHSSMALVDFIKQACTVYAKTVVGKAKQGDRDLTLIPTFELLSDAKYRTLPGRAEELTTRAIQAIMHHNDMATEKNQKWCITAGAVNALTGSKMGLIQKVMEGCKLAINDHNIKHGLNPYDNRGRATTIDKDIDFVNFNKTATPEVIRHEMPEEPATLEAPEMTVPVAKEPKPKVETMDAKTTTIQEIMDFLSQNPNTKVRLKEGRKAIHYTRAEDENGVMYGIKNEETGEVTELKR